MTSHFLNTSSICQKIDAYQAHRVHGSDINILHSFNTHKNRPSEFYAEKKHRCFHRCQVIILNLFDEQSLRFSYNNIVHLPIYYLFFQMQQQQVQSVDVFAYIQYRMNHYFLKRIT